MAAIRDKKSEFINLKDGKVAIYKNQASSAYFKSEKDLQDYIVNNIKKFCVTVLEDELISYIAEHRISGSERYNRSKKIDLIIECKKNTYVIELKNPRYKSENISAIGQILDYGRLYGKKSVLVIISTTYDKDTVSTINHYSLPIKFIYAEDELFLVYEKTSK